TDPGSAEVPSAGRPFTPELVTRLVSSGIQIAPLLLHTGVASLEDHEPPYEEYFRVPPETADRVNGARRTGHRVIAVGTTVVRALESVTDSRGRTSPGEGDRKSTRLNSSHVEISYAVFCLKKKKKQSHECELAIRAISRGSRSTS